MLPLLGCGGQGLRGWYLMFGWQCPLALGDFPTSGLPAPHPELLPFGVPVPVPVPYLPTSGFDPLPQGEGCRGLVGMLWVGSPLEARGRGGGVGAGAGAGGVRVTSPGGGGGSSVGAGLRRGVNFASSSSGHRQRWQWVAVGSSVGSRVASRQKQKRVSGWRAETGGGTAYLSPCSSPSCRGVGRDILVIGGDEVATPSTTCHALPSACR